MNEKFDKTINDLAIHYDKLVKKFGNNVKSSQQSTITTRKKRLDILLQYVDIKKKNSILDFGCGTGFLYQYLKSLGFKGSYLGIDISPEAIKLARNLNMNNSKCDFLLTNIFDKKVKKKFDYVLINGTFNNNTNNNWNWMRKSLIQLFSVTKKAIIFNNLSYYVDYYDKKLFYIKPEKVFNFCKQKLSEKIILNNSYVLKKNTIPYEFTTYVKKND
jgi:SAM-dependent methyltransferase